MEHRNLQILKSIDKNNKKRLNKSQVIKTDRAMRDTFSEYSLYERFYTLSIDKTIVESGDVFTITLETEKVDVGEIIPYTISGIELIHIDELNSDDDLKGDFIVDESNVASISFKISDGIVLDQLSKFNLSLDNGKSEVSTVLVSYELTVDKTTVDEGDSVIFTLNVYGLDDVFIPYTISGSNITPDDLNVISLTDSFYIVGGSSSVQFFIDEDLTTEGDEVFTLSLDNGAGSKSVTIVDTSKEPVYTLTSPSEVNEGGTIVINLTTQGVNEGDIINYTVDGIAQSDIVESLTGSFTIGSDGTDQAQFTVVEDALTEGGETFKLTLIELNKSIDVDIIDTSRTSSYSLDVDNSIVNETNYNEFTVTLITQNVNSGTVIDYTMSDLNSSITVDDFVGLNSLTGNFVVGATDSITFTLDSDFKSEDIETIIFSLDNGHDLLSINIEDSSVPTYTLTGPSQVDEGDVITINLSTQGVNEGDLVNYAVEGITYSDIAESLTGSFTIGGDGTAQAQFTVIEDETSDGDDPFRLVLDTPLNEFIDVTIIDTSKTPGFNLTSTVDVVDETLPNNVVVITLETENVAQGEQFGYTISGDGVTLDDFIGLTSFTGTFTVGSDGNDSFTLTIDEDYITENNEIITISLNNNQASKNIIINDTSVETYEIEVENSITTVNEGDSFKVILTTRGVVDNTQVPYSITGVSSNDIGGVNTGGDFTVVNNTAEVTFNITEDFSSIDPSFKENLESFILTLTDTGEQVSLNINDTSVQTFVLTTDKENVNNNVNEGESVTITLTTQGVVNGVTVPYTISGAGITPVDLGIGDLSNSFTINNNTSSVTFNINEDVTTEGNEDFVITLDGLGVSKTVTILDTSKAPVYTLERSASEVDEGESFTITLNTQNPINGTVISYTIGGIQTEDINNTSITGSFIVGSVESRSFLVTSDNLTEGNEDFVITLDGLGVSKTVTIIDVVLAQGNPDAMVLTVDTTLKTDRTFEIFNTNNIVVNWGDGNPEEYFYGDDYNQTQNMSHTYPVDGDGSYTVSIIQGPARDTIGMRFGWGGDAPTLILSADMITEISSWGKMKFKTFEYFLSHAKNITQLPSGSVPPEFNTSEVTDFKYAFTYNRSLESFPEGFDTSSGEIFVSTWYDCNTLISFPDINISSATELTRTWKSSKNIASFPTNLIDNIINSATITSLKETWRDCSSLLNSTFNNFDAPINLTNDGLNGTWRSCSGLTSFPSITIPTGVTKLGYTWGDCEGLLSFPDSIINQITNSVTITSLDGTWYGCSNLPDGTYDNFDVPQNTTILDAAFGFNSQLTYFPQIDTSDVTSMRQTWSICTNLVSFPSIDVGKVTSMNQTWDSCTNLESFGAFSNDEYVTCNYFLTFSNTKINVTKSDNPFTNLKLGSNIPVASGFLTFRSTFRSVDGITYLPPFYIGDATHIAPFGVSVPELSEGSDIFGWENCTFSKVNLYNGVDHRVISIPTLTTDEYDDIITKLHSNISNHTPLNTGNNYYANFSNSIYSSSVATKRQDLIDNGWEILDGGEEPTYILQSTSSQVDEGESFTITLNTENPINGTVISYTIGGIQTEDINNTSITGSFIVGSVESRSFLVTSDNLTEGNEDFVITLDGLGVSETVTIQSPTYDLVQLSIEPEVANEPVANVKMNDSGDMVAVSSWLEDGDAGADSGAVRVYKRINSNWEQLGYSIQGESGGDKFGKWISFNGSGNILAISSGDIQSDSYIRVYEWREFNDGDTNQYHYTSTTQSTSQTKKLIASNGSEPIVGQSYWMQLGYDYNTYSRDHSISLSLNSVGDIMVVGYPTYIYSKGSVVLFRYHNGQWVGDTGVAQMVGVNNDQYLGINTSINGAGDIVACNDNMYVKIFKDPDFGNTTDTRWLELIGDINLYTPNLALLPYVPRVSLNMAGDIVATSTTLNDFTYLVRVYKNTGTNTWDQIGGDTIDSGSWISLNAAGDVIVVGSPNSYEMKVYNYDITNDVWVPIPGTYTGDEGSGYGYVVDINHSGTDVVVSEYNTGKVKTYNISSINT